MGGVKHIMDTAQPGILAGVPPLARYLSFSLSAGSKPMKALSALAVIADGDEVVVGVGAPLAAVLNCNIPGLKVFPSRFESGLVLPSASSALWCWLRGKDRGVLLHRSRIVAKILDGAFALDSVIDSFVYDGGRDLTGYIDGTENPKGRRAYNAAIVQDQGRGMDGSTFVAVQRWIHDFQKFAAMSQKHQDDAIGRRRSDNKELAGAPRSAHVKRTAQESFSPEAFILRRSMPWSDGINGGLNFVAFGKSFDAFEAQLRRMLGAEDGVTDALFKFTRPVSGSYFWCPPMAKGNLDLRQLGL